MPFWKRHEEQEDVITVSINNYGDHIVTYDQIEEYCQKNNIKKREFKDDLPFSYEIAKIIVIEGLLKTLRDDIDSLQKIQTTSKQKVNLNKSSFDKEFKDEYEWEIPKTEKLKGDEFESFVNSFLDDEFIERIKKEDKRQYTHNSANPQREKERMQRNAQFWNSYSSYDPYWLSELGFTDISQVTKEEINKRFRKFAVKCHPDHGGTDEDFRKLTKAKEDALFYIGG